MLASTERQHVEPDAIYGAIVTALAVFFAGLIIAHPRHSQYVCSSDVLLHNVDDSQSSGGRSLIAQPHDLDLQAISNAARSTDLQAGHPTRLWTRERLDDLASRIAIAQIGGQPEWTRAMRVSFRGTDVIWSRIFTEQLACQLLQVASRQRPAARMMGDAIRRARWSVHQTRHYERKARFDIEDALITFAQRMGGSSAATAVATIASPPGSTDGRVAQSGHLRKGHRQQVQRRLRELQSQLDELLTTLMPNHPRVRHLTAQIEQSRRELAGLSLGTDQRALPKHGSVTAALAGAEPEIQLQSQQAAFTAAAEPQSTWDGDHLTQLSDYAKLQQLYQRAVEQREAAEQRLDELLSRQQRQRSPDRAWMSGIVRPHIAARRVGGSISSRLLLVTSVISLVGGVSCYWHLRSIKRCSSPDAGRPCQGFAQWPRMDTASLVLHRGTQLARFLPHGLSRWWVRAGEFVLLVFVALFLLSALQGTPVAAEFIAQPLDAFVSRVAAMLVV